MKLIILVCAIILGSFAAGHAISSDKCVTCQNFVKFLEYPDGETICARACDELSDEANESAELTDFVIMGCSDCKLFASQITSGLHRFSFRDIIPAVSHGCTPRIRNCRAFLSAKEDELIDAIYHYKTNTQSICHAVHQC